MVRWLLALGGLVALLGGAAAERAVTGHAAWAPASVVVSPSPFPSPVPSPYPVVSASPVPVAVPGPVRTVLVESTPPADPLAFERCLAFTNPAMKAACKYGQGDTLLRPTDPADNCSALYDRTSKAACLYGSGETDIRP